MYGLLALISGILCAAMVAVNGELTGVYGVYTATVMIHVAGLILISLIVCIRKERPFAVRAGFVNYLGGVLGVLTSSFTNIAYGGISVSAILALTLLGQCVIGLAFDEWGLVGIPVRRFQKRKLIGLALTLLGIGCMLDSFAFVPVLLSFLSGAILVLSRALNMRLMQKTSVAVSTFFNYVTGLCGSLFMLLIAGGGEPGLSAGLTDPRLYIYCGGLIGVAVVGIGNMTVGKISTFYLTLFQFVGQVFMGVAIDALLSGGFSAANLVGGSLVALGLTVNLLLDRRPLSGAPQA